MEDILVTVSRITKILNEKIWFKKLLNQVQDDSEKEKFSAALINRTIAIYNKIDTQEDRELFEEILDEIDVLVLSDYSRLLNRCYIELRKKYPKIENFYVIPLLKKNSNEDNKVKSGMFVSYLFNTYHFSFIDEVENFQGAKIKVIKYLDDNTLTKIEKSENSMIIFADDFVGTGTTVVSVYKSYFKNSLDLIETRTCLIALSILDIGLQKINEEGIPLIFGTEFLSLTSKFKGNIDKKDNIIRVVRTLSNSFKIKNNKIGYKDSASTVITIRTPNNNVPFLWSSKVNKRKPLFIRNE
ncbi:phosphoribosyltransferase-like protein [Enterococcus sp. LJL99]